MTAIRTVFFIFVAGALGGFATGILVWLLGKTGITPALGFHMVPDLTAGWMSRRMFASGIWGAIFLIPILRNSPLTKGAVLGVLPWLSSILIVLPFRMKAGWFGLDMGYGTPIWTLIFGCLWGVIGMWFLSRFHPQLKLR